MAAHLAKARDPWGAEKPGAWYRFKTSADGKDAYQDLGLKEAGEGYRLLLVQSKSREPEEPEQHRWIEVREIAPRGEKSLDFGVGTLAVDLAALSTPRGETLLWVVRDGPHAGAVIHTETKGVHSSIRKLSLETLKVGVRSFDCLVVEEEEGGGRRITRWFSTSCPAGPVKTVAGAITEVLVDAGTDWATRPPFPPSPEAAAKPQDPEPPPKPPPPPPPKEDPAVKTKAMLTEAAALLKESMPAYQEIAAATNPAPTERDLRAKWKSRALEVKAKLLRARELYAACRDTDPVVLDRRVGTIDGLIESLEETLKRLE